MTLRKALEGSNSQEQAVPHQEVDTHNPKAAAYCALPEKVRSAVDIIATSMTAKMQKIPNPTPTQLEEQKQNAQLMKESQTASLVTYLKMPAKKLGRDPKEDIIKQAEAILAEAKKKNSNISSYPVYPCSTSSSEPEGQSR